MANEKDIYHILPDKHFDPLMTKVLGELKNGESVCVYGMPGVGRRYFARQVEILAERQKLADHILFFEATVCEKGMAKEIENGIKEITGEMGVRSDLRSYLQNHKIVIVIGYIERLKDKRQVFEFLTKLRVLHQTNIAILTTCDQTILTNQADYFIGAEQIADSFYGMDLFGIEGTGGVIGTLTKTYGWKIKNSQIEQIYSLSGGNASLIKYICKAVDIFGPQVLTDTQQLINYPPLKVRMDEFVDIITTNSEQVLKSLNIINKKRRIFARLVTQYLRSYQIARLEFMFPDLTKTEYRVLSYLFLNQGKIIDNDRLAFYKIISRIKRKIEGKFILENVKGRGYRLITN